MNCKRIEMHAQMPTRSVPRNPDIAEPMNPIGMQAMTADLIQPGPTMSDHVPRAAAPATSLAAPVVAWSQPDASGWQTPLHQSPGAHWPQTNTNQGTTLDDASVTESDSEFVSTRQQPERTDDTTGAGQGCATNLKLFWLYFIYMYRIYSRIFSTCLAQPI